MTKLKLIFINILKNKYKLILSINKNLKKFFLIKV